MLVILSLLLNLKLFYCSNQVIENVSQASYKTKVLVENVAGVKIPIFDKIASDSADSGMKRLVDLAIIIDCLVGLAKGGRAVAKCKDTYRVSLDLLIKLASLQVFQSDYCS